MVVVTISIISILLIRAIQLYKFLSKVSRLCYIYDRNFINENGDENPNLIIEFMGSNYHLTTTWSAYHWMFLKGPNPLLMFFSDDPLTLECQYGKKIIEELNKYEVIEDYKWEKNKK
jgi:hypothetical protein